MLTVYDKDGKAHSYTHGIDAREAIERGFMFAYPPGEGPAIPASESMGFGSLTKTQLVQWAYDNHEARLDINTKQEVLIEQCEDLANKKHAKKRKKK